MSTPATEPQEVTSRDGVTIRPGDVFFAVNITRVAPLVCEKIVYPRDGSGAQVAAGFETLAPRACFHTRKAALTEFRATILWRRDYLLKQLDLLHESYQKVEADLVAMQASEALLPPPCSPVPNVAPGTIS